jgi:hypothetical protein
MNLDIQLPLTSTQYGLLKHAKNLRAKIQSVLPKSRLTRIRTFLNDPAYDLRLVRPYRKNASYLRLRLGQPRRIISFERKFAAVISEVARQRDITVNQLLYESIKERFSKMSKDQ